MPTADEQRTAQWTLRHIQRSFSDPNRRIASFQLCIIPGWVPGITLTLSLLFVVLATKFQNLVQKKNRPGRVLCTWWLLGLALKRPWLVPGGQPHALTAWTGLENTTLTLQRAGFLQERLLGL